jgi:ribosomal protein L40E
MSAINFHCRECGVETASAPDPPALAICEDCCEDHDCQYERELRKKVCIYCGADEPQDWDVP